MSAADKCAGRIDYFDGASVITNADTVVDIATILAENHSSNMEPSKLAGLLSEKGYDVQVVKMGEREAIKFANGDFFYDSDGDGSLGTKDQNFQSALTLVEQNYGVDLSELKNSKYTAYHKCSELGKGKDLSGLDVTVLKSFGAFEGRDLSFEQQRTSSLVDEAWGCAIDSGSENLNEVVCPSEGDAVFAELDEQLQAAGYNRGISAYTLWREGELRWVLAEYGIDEPTLPDTNEPVSNSMALFSAALSIAAYLEN